jgi:ParB family chromosome partitioning protein
MASEVRAVCTTSSPSPGNPEAGTLPTVTVGGITYRLRFADLLPALSDDDLSALRGDIRERGIVVPIVIDEHHNIIDGANRLRIAAELGIRNLRADIQPGLSDAEKEELAEDLNLHRRHLSREQLREVNVPMLLSRSTIAAIACSRGLIRRTAAAPPSLRRRR